MKIIKTNEKDMNTLSLMMIALICAIIITISALNQKNQGVSAYAIEDTETAIDIPYVEERDDGNKENSDRSQTSDTYAIGHFEWKDASNVTHPLRHVKIELYDSDQLTDELLGSTTTDNNGNFYIAFHNDTTLLENGCDLFLRIYAGDDNAYVVMESNISQKYYMETSKTQHTNVLTGITIDFESEVPTFTSVNDLGQAMQVSQAILTARDFAQAMGGNNYSVPSAKVVYPSFQNSCDCSYGQIFIDSSTYHQWDVIMHEYGHHIAYCAELEDSPGGWHKWEYNMADHYYSVNSSECNGKCARHRLTNPISSAEAKETGVKISWAEAWATIFSILAQEYYSDMLTGIPNVADGYYSEGNLSYDYDNNSYFLGEACEASIAGILWDLYDGGTETNDTINLGFQNWWDVTVGSEATFFSIFIDYFYYEYPTLMGALGDNLTQFKMAVNLSLLGGENVEIAPSMNPTVFSVLPQGGSSNFGNDGFTFIIYSEDFSQYYKTNTYDNYTIQTLTSAMFNNIKSFPGDEVHVAICAIQTTTYPTGFYVSNYFTFKKRMFITSYELYNNQNRYTITGMYSHFLNTNNLIIPTEIGGIAVEVIGAHAFEGAPYLVVGFESASEIIAIGDNAFYQSSLCGFTCPVNLEYIGINAFSNLLGDNGQGVMEAGFGSLIWGTNGNSLTHIGQNAFYLTKLPFLKQLPSSITTIDGLAFNSSQLPVDFIIPMNSNLSSIGAAGFAGNSMRAVFLSSSVETIGYNAFNNCNNLTIYTSHSSKPSTWNNSWNNSNRPVFWGCVLSADGSYIDYFTKSTNTLINANASNGISDPYREGYTFNGWYVAADPNTLYTSANIASAPDTVLYTKWTANSSCVAAGSMITLADGTQVAVENLTGNESLLVWNMLTGQFDSAPILFIDSDSLYSYEIIKLTFSDGTEVKVIDEHAFFDMTLGEYVFLRSDASQYIGHYFNKKSGNMWTAVQLTNVTITIELTTAWSPVTYGHLCYYVNGMLSMPGATEGFINIFDVDTTLMKYDAVQMAADIQTYGLYTYAEFNAIIPLPEYVFNAFNGQYLKVSIGKGLITLEEIVVLLERYAIFFS